MISVTDVVFRYDDAVALDGVSTRVEDGEWLLIAGPNGGGKTTLVRHFNALLTPDEGVVRVDGHETTENAVAARTAVGMVFQNPRDQFVAATLSADVAFGPENLGLDRDEIDRRAEDALEAVGLAGRREDRIDELSGGEQARAAIAGALAMEPDHLVLDEPFAGLDWPARRSVLDRLDDLHAEGTSVVVVTHDVRDVFERADRALCLADGRIVAEGPPSAVVDDLATNDVRVPEC